MSTPRSFVLAALLALAPFSLAQDKERVLDPSVPGRNTALKGLLAQGTRAAAAGVVKITRDGREVGYGALLADGWVLTADAVVAPGGTYEVTGAAGRFPAGRAGANAEHGVALLRLTVAGRAPQGIALGRSGELAVGQLVACAGTEGEALAAGVVSATARRVEKSEEAMAHNFLLALFSDGSNQGHQRDFPAVIQHDSPLLPEQLGAPLVDVQGRLVGINVATPWRGSTHAVPIDGVAPLLPAMQKAAPPPPVAAAPPAESRPREEARPAGKAWVGIHGDLAPRDKVPGIYAGGVLLDGVEGPAAEAGVKTGDVLVLVDGNGFKDLDGFSRYFAGKKPGQKVKLSLVRESKLLELEVTLGTK